MLEKFKNILHSDFPDISNYRLYLAISGGKDSMVLSHLLSSAGLKHTLLHCNFNLRGKESKEDEQFLHDYSARSGLDLKVKQFDTYKHIEETGKTIQEAARELRYEWFASFAQQDNSLILTAHHLDDSIETFFINLLRGTGYKGVKGIPTLNLPYYRPLSSFTAEEIYSYIDEFSIDYREDSSNRDTKYLRNKLRHDLVPNFIELDESFKVKMLSFFTEMNNVDTFIDNNIRSLRKEMFTYQNEIINVNLDSVHSLDQFTIQLLFNPFGIKRSNINSFKEFTKAKTGSVFNTESHSFLIDRDTVLIRKNVSEKSNISFQIDAIPSRLDTPFLKVSFSSSTDIEIVKSNNPLQLDLSKVAFPLKLRKWENGDKIVPLGMKGSKLISDILVDRKLSLFEKREIMVLEDDYQNIIAIPGLIISDTVKIDDRTSELMILTSDKP